MDSRCSFFFLVKGLPGVSMKILKGLRAGMDDVGTTYKTFEAYLEALERRHAQEKAPPAAVFSLGSVDMMLKTYGGHPWLTRVRCGLPTRPLGPGGEEEPVRCTYIGALDEENAEQYQTVVEGMASIDVFK